MSGIDRGDEQRRQRRIVEAHRGPHRRVLDVRDTKIITEITQPEVIERFLAALDLPAEHPDIERARPPPQLELPLDQVYEEPRIEAMDEGA